jgi:hypothetical protein
MTRRLLFTLLLVLAVGLLVPAAALAAGYGPPTPPTSSAPGGFSAVVAAKTIGTGGGSLSGTVAGAQVTVTIPANALSSAADVELVAPQLSAIPQAVAGVGVYLFVNGEKFSGSLATPATITITNPAISASDTIDVWNGSSFVAASNGKVSAGSASASFSSDPDFAVLSAISAATIPATGVPVLGEILLAIGLIAVGGGLALVLRRHRATV